MVPTRRSFLAAFLAGSGLAPLALHRAAAQAAPPLELTPECIDHAPVTLAQTEGPYFKPNAPLKRDLAADAPRGERIAVAGFVVDAACRPVAKALIQLWHADESGAYDNTGFRLRGYQLTDDSGRWWFETIVPALYPGRTRHYHVKVQRPGGRVLTTQLYFPGEPQNRRDPIFNEKLLMKIGDSGEGKIGRYDFVLS
ncbi:MAG: intradiol ring-cleavage dioxygenase [Proteobacteria bacterium]|nr:intradiol ring-cleavage dioxygenase [Pseudomonadota bacterium]MBI3499727.1 intradiol ring-cleavage dioxygenase [Pseudomonadota bacterium]